MPTWLNDIKPQVLVIGLRFWVLYIKKNIYDGISCFRNSNILNFFQVVKTSIEAESTGQIGWNSNISLNCDNNDNKLKNNGYQ